MLAVERYSRVMGGDDAIYFYTERACVGALAAAAWRSGSVALEEFQLEKSTKKKAEWLGRADLYISSENHDDFIEAKYEWASMKPRRNLTDIFESSLKAALKDAKATYNRDKESAYVGASFFPMYISESRESELEALIEQSIVAAKGSNAHAVAWCFPQSMKNFVSDNKNFNPGVIMVASNLRYT